MKATANKDFLEKNFPKYLNIRFLSRLLNEGKYFYNLEIKEHQKNMEEFFDVKIISRNNKMIEKENFFVKPKNEEYGILELDTRNFIIMKEISDSLKNKKLYSWKKGEKISIDNKPEIGDIIATFSENFFTENNSIGCVLYASKGYVLILEQSKLTRNALGIRLLTNNNNNYFGNFLNYYHIDV